MAILVPANFLLTWIAANRSSRVASALPGPFAGLLVALVLWSTFTVASIEVLSVVSMVRPAGLLVVQVFWLLGALTYLRTHSEPSTRSGNWDWLKGTDWKGRAVRTVVLTIAIATFVIGVFSQVTTPDSMTYHLPRVLHWLQNSSSWPYEAIVGRQVWQPPLPGYLLLPVMGLTQSDAHVWTTQWVAYIASVLLVVRITWQLGGGQPTQQWAALLAATVPLAVLQATTAQNDLLAAVMFLCCVSLALSDVSEDVSASRTWLVGAAFGLAILTKGSLWPVLLPVGAYVAVKRITRDRVRAVAGLTAIGVAALALSGPFLIRNVSEYGSIQGPHRVASKSGLDLGIIASNTVRNSALELITPWEEANEAITDGVAAAHRVVGVDVDDPRGMLGQETFYLPVGWNSEGSAGAPVHVLAIVVAVVSQVLTRRWEWRDTSVHVASIAFVGLVALSAAIPWMRWNARLLLPLLMVGLPVISVWVSRFSDTWRSIVTSATSGLAGALAAAVLLFPSGHVVAGSGSLFVASDLEELASRLRPFEARSLEMLASDLSTLDCSVVGVVGEENSKEYLVWWVLGQRFAWRDVTVIPRTSGNFEGQQQPCAVVAMNRREPAAVSVHGRVLDPLWVEGGYALFVP